MDQLLVKLHMLGALALTVDTGAEEVLQEVLARGPVEAPADLHGN